MEPKDSQYEGEEKIEIPEPKTNKSQAEDPSGAITGPKIDESNNQEAEQIESAAMESRLEQMKLTKKVDPLVKPTDPQT